MAIRPVLRRLYTHGVMRMRTAGSPIVRCLSDAGETGTSQAPDVKQSDSFEIDMSQIKTHSFQAETTKLLDIVAKSLYSEREVFVRELISNAVDALEKLRYMQTTGEDIENPDLPLSISISTDAANNTFTIEDTGIGMTEDELIENLGTIARSGSKAFIENLSSSGSGNSQAKENIIGQFGVGFYAGFMVGDEITVFSKSYHTDMPANVWKSSGHGSYTLAPARNIIRGTKIQIKLREDAAEFKDGDKISAIIKKYSNFVGFPITVNGARVNTVQPLWTMKPSDVTEEQHESFYKFISNAFDKPLFTIQYNADAPLMIRSVLYIPTMQMEKFGMGRMDPGVSLYCRKVLIKGKMENLLPSWMRFVRGVVDSEDIPLNLSRELLQDSALITRIGDIIAGRILKHIKNKKESDRDAFKNFATEYATFLREGVCTDDSRKEAIAQLLLVQSSALDSSETTTIDEYIGRQKENDSPIYYILANTRDAAMTSPYMESMLAEEKEVIIMNHPLDVFVVEHLKEVNGKKLVSIESSEAVTETTSNADVSKEFQVGLQTFFETTLGKDKVKEVKISNRLKNSPAIIVDHESAGRRRLADKTSKDKAVLVVEQLYDNALISAGLLEEPRTMVGRLNKLCELLLPPDSETNRNSPVLDNDARDSN
eukprot:gene9426-1668_t